MSYNFKKDNSTLEYKDYLEKSLIQQNIEDSLSYYKALKLKEYSLIINKISSKNNVIILNEDKEDFKKVEEISIPLQIKKINIDENKIFESILKNVINNNEFRLLNLSIYSDDSFVKSGKDKIHMISKSNASSIEISLFNDDNSEKIVFNILDRLKYQIIRKIRIGVV